MTCYAGVFKGNGRNFNNNDNNEFMSVGRIELLAYSGKLGGRTVLGVAPGFADFEAHGYYIQGSYFIIPKKLQAVVKWEELSPGQRTDDGIQSITGGLNYYIQYDNVKIMANYVHTWSDFRSAHPQFGDDHFDELLLRLQVSSSGL